MSDLGMNHFRNVQQCLNGEGAPDEQTFASLAILEERLERLRKLDPVFAGVGFSSDVKGLLGQKRPVAVS